jgi:hypothetical protein
LVDRPQALHTHAEDNIRFIRDTMSKASQFTAVPGWGGVAMGVTAIVAAGLISRQTDSRRWVTWWFGEAAVAMAIGALTMTWKATRLNLPLLAAPARRFALAYLPPLAAGAILTPVFFTNGLASRLPGCWLLLYGVAIATAGTLSIRIVQSLGLSFMALGAASFLAPASYGDLFMAAGFGGLHILFGLIIARKHGG